MHVCQSSTCGFHDIKAAALCGVSRFDGCRIRKTHRKFPSVISIWGSRQLEDQLREEGTVLCSLLGAVR